MDFSHYSSTPVDLAVALVNTDQTKCDALETLDDLVEFLSPYDDLLSAAKPPRRKDLEGLRELRSSLRAVFEATDGDAAARHLNQILQAHHATPRLSVHSGTPHFHFDPADNSTLAWTATTTAMGLATAIAESGFERFGVCCSGDCRDVYVDTSRNRSKRHCSTTCSTREAVSAYRKRQAVDA